MRILFMGSPDFNRGYLERIKEIGKDDIIGVFTKPDRPKGRGHKIIFSEVKKFALDNKIPLFQPKSIRKGDVIEGIKSLKPELILVIAYGHILPGEIIQIPANGCINIHFSLLPKYRGPAPIQWALLNGERITGVTSILMDEIVDHGRIVVQGRVEILPDDNFLSLQERLLNKGLDTMAGALDLIRAGNPPLEVQDERLVTFAPLIKKVDGEIVWQDSAECIYNRVRALNPWPSTFTHLKGKRLKILGARPIGEIHNSALKEGVPGQIVQLERDKGFIVQCGDGFLLVTDVQMENKAVCKAYDFAQGARINIGDRLN